MEDIFISHIHINQVRHLKNLDIPLSATERQHLILTGANGSGKTSFLVALKEYFKGVESNWIYSIDTYRQAIEQSRTQLITLENKLKADLDETQKAKLNSQKSSIIGDIRYKQGQLDPFIPLDLKISNLGSIVSAFQSNDFIYTYFDSKRSSNFKKPTGPQKLELENIYRIDAKANTNFIQYIVNLRYDKLDAKDSNNQKEAEAIDIWFDKFTNALKDIFEDETLTLEFDRPNYNYNIILRGREKFDLNTLSDGYSAVMNILTELILRMEKKSSHFYDVQGIVLIDEIETHLHIDLQKKILPFLTAFFPKIQFIVTTHSPFVLTSVKNAVVYDLEKQEALTDLSGYSVEAIIESYFGQDKYANVLTEKVNQYEKLMSKNALSEAEREEKRDLRGYFKNLPYFLAPELQVKIQQIELAQLGK